MPVPELTKLRRFALATGLVLLSYSVAGIELKPGAEASLFGVPFVIIRPELLPFGLVLASVYGLLRFYYYGLMLSDSPYRYRKDLLSKLQVKDQTGRYKGSVYKTASESDREHLERQTKTIIEAFPKFAGRRVSDNVKSVNVNVHKVGPANGGEHYFYEAEITIPRWCRLIALVEDIDYTLPIWLNIVALSVAVIRLMR